jgi:PAS domain-containing protein
MYYGISNLRILDITPVARNAIFDYIKNGVVVIDPQGRVADVNSVARNIPELPRKNDDIHAWSLGMRSDLARMLKSDSSHGELRLGGWRSPRDYEVESYEMRDCRDWTRGRLVLLRDVTEKRKVQEQLRQSEERYRAVIEQAAEGIFLYDLQSRRILESNAAF